MSPPRLQKLEQLLEEQLRWPDELLTGGEASAGRKPPPAAVDWPDLVREEEGFAAC